MPPRPKPKPKQLANTKILPSKKQQPFLSRSFLKRLMANVMQDLIDEALDRCLMADDE